MSNSIAPVSHRTDNEFLGVVRRYSLLTKTWTAEYGRSGVRINAVSPGPTRTEGTDSMGEGLDQLAAEAPAGRPATADEIAEAIVFLATDRSSFIQGAKLASADCALRASSVAYE